MSLLRLFRAPGLPSSQVTQLLTRATDFLDSPLSGMRTEVCFYIQSSSPLTDPEMATLRWLLSETFEPQGFSDGTLLGEGGPVLEVGPRMNFTTAWSTNAVAICHAGRSRCLGVGGTA